MTVYLVPCGVSVWDGLRQSRGKPRDAPSLSGVEPVLCDWAAHARQMPDPEVVPHWQDRVDPETRSAFPHWGPPVCAETSTIAARCPDLARVVEDGHQVMLIASDTDSGVAAAMLVATHLARGRAAVSYHSVPVPPAGDDWSPPPAGHPVGVFRIRDLKPQSPEGLRRATAGIGRVLRAGFDHAAGAPVEVHLTGGLKSTLLYLLTMSEVLHSLPDGEVTAWYLPESRGHQTQAVPIDLRRFPAEDLDLMRDELTAVRDGWATGERRFYGTGWSETDGRRHLNAFGRGFLTVLGERALRRAGDGLSS